MIVSGLLRILFFGITYIPFIEASQLLSEKSEYKKRNVSIKNITNFVKDFPLTQVKQVTSYYKFNYRPFPLRFIYGNRLWFPAGFFRDLFILEVKDGITYINAEEKENNMYSYYLFVNDIFLEECSHYHLKPKQLFFSDLAEVQYIKGRVAIVHDIFYPEYGHFILDLLSNLALLELNNVQYDYLLIPSNYQYMKEVLDLWGIDQSKIIISQNNHPIKADTLIFNTAPGIMVDKGLGGFGLYRIDFLIQYIRQKLLDGVNKLNLSLPYSLKIFLSKKDSVMGGRNIPNEDDVFNEFKKLGYERYEFSKMSMAEKIYRASKATHLVSSVGSGSLHAIFMQPKGCLIEIQTTYPESSFCYLVQNVGIDYKCINCTTFEDLRNNNWLTAGKNISIDIIKNFLNNHSEL